MGELAELFYAREALEKKGEELKKKLIALVPEDLKNYINRRGEYIFDLLLRTGLATDTLIAPYLKSNEFRSIREAQKQFVFLQKAWAGEVKINVTRKGSDLSGGILYLAFYIEGVDEKGVKIV